MNSENSKTSNPYRLSHNFTDKINLKRSDKYVRLLKLSIYYAWKNVESQMKIMNLKCQLQHGMESLNCLMDHALYQIFEITLNIS